jgi:anti-sigma28 factor (negative regulator of flagellin synthesis)
MKVNEPKEIRGLDRTPAPVERDLPRPKTDRVSLEAADQTTRLVESARQLSSVGRAGRLKQLESAIRTGSFRPNAGQLAEQLLQAAELDARLRAMLQR